MIYTRLRALAVTAVVAGGTFLAAAPRPAHAQPVVVIERPHHWHHWHHRERRWDGPHRHWHYRYW